MVHAASAQCFFFQAAAGFCAIQTQSGQGAENIRKATSFRGGEGGNAIATRPDVSETTSWGGGYCLDSYGEDCGEVVVTERDGASECSSSSSSSTG